MLMWSGDAQRENGSRLTFHDIDEGGFEWVGENVKGGVATPTWKSSCKRRSPGAAGHSPTFMGFDPSPARPFGAPHPDAPEPLDGLGFLVGAFETTRGEAATPGLRSGTYFLNGWGIQISAYEPGASWATLVLYDRSAQLVRASTFRMPGYEWTVWDGSAQDGGFVFQQARAAGARAGSRRLELLRLPDGGHEVIVHDGEVSDVTTCAPAGRDRAR